MKFSKPFSQTEELVLFKIIIGAFFLFPNNST